MLPAAADGRRADKTLVVDVFDHQADLVAVTGQHNSGTSLGVDGGNREALRARGEILADIGEATSAKLDLERPSVRDRASALAAHGLAMAELGDYSRATEEIDAARTSAPHDGRVLFYAARASALKGDKVTSWELAQQAVDATNPPLSPSHRDAAIKLAGHE